MTAITENLDRIAEATKEFNEFLQEDQLEFEDVSVCDLLERIFADLDDVACEKKLHYDGLLSERPWVMADREKLDSAVRNFLREAVQFTGDDGTLEISARQESGKILLEFSATRGHAAPGADEPDFSAACKLWRLQGGRVYVNRLSDECFWIGCELPALRASGC